MRIAQRCQIHFCLGRTHLRNYSDSAEYNIPLCTALPFTFLCSSSRTLAAIPTAAPTKAYPDFVFDGEKAGFWMLAGLQQGAIAKTMAREARHSQHPIDAFAAQGIKCGQALKHSFIGTYLGEPAGYQLAGARCLYLTHPVRLPRYATDSAGLASEHDWGCSVLLHCAGQQALR